MIWSALITRGGLLVANSIILALLVYIRRRSPAARPYTGPFVVLAAFHVLFYAFATLFRMGLFAPPTPDFFSHLSNARSWFTAAAALGVLVPMAIDLWTGRRS